MTNPVRIADTQTKPWLDLHPLWLALSRAHIPGKEWAAWNRAARQYGVAFVVVRVELEARR